MRFSPDHTRSRAMIPPSHRCIWMTAGILSYQLCDRTFDCDTCPLDAAMRMHFEANQHHTAPTDAQQIVSNSMRYSNNHCWIAAMSTERLRVGIVPMFSSLLSPKEIILPRPGDCVSNRQYCWWIVLEGGTLSFTSPVNGTVAAIHNALITDPGTIKHSSSQEWLFDVAPEKGVERISSLMEKKEADALYKSEYLRFTTLIHEAITKHTGTVGSAFPDGGTVLLENSAMLGNKKYFEILTSVFGEKMPVAN